MCVCVRAEARGENFINLMTCHLRKSGGGGGRNEAAAEGGGEKRENNNIGMLRRF